MAKICIPDGKIVTPEMKAEAAANAMKAAFRTAIQSHIDATAAARDYADGAALAGYVASTVQPWAAEAQAFVAWRDAVWVYVFAELKKVEKAERAAPESVEAFVAELPEMVWPD